MLWAPWPSIGRVVYLYVRPESTHLESWRQGSNPWRQGSTTSSQRSPRERERERERFVTDYRHQFHRHWSFYVFVSFKDQHERFKTLVNKCASQMRPLIDNPWSPSPIHNTQPHINTHTVADRRTHTHRCVCGCKCLGMQITVVQGAVMGVVKGMDAGLV